MKTIDVLRILQRFNKRIYNFSDLKKLLNAKSDDSLYVKISRLVESGLLKRIKKGVYYLEGREPDSFEIANVLYEPSYLSLETALNYYGILVQTPYIIFSITTKRAKRVIFNNIEYHYLQINRKYFKGYTKEKNFLIATPEKALVDTLYFMALGKTKVDIDELNLEVIDKNILKSYISEIDNRVFKRFIKRINI